VFSRHPHAEDQARPKRDTTLHRRLASGNDLVAVLTRRRPVIRQADPTIAPSGILPGQSDDDRYRASRNGPPPGSMWLGPFVADQFSVPTEQGFGLTKSRPNGDDQGADSTRQAAHDPAVAEPVGTT
jgi:hypothetical protein